MAGTMRLVMHRPIGVFSLNGVRPRWPEQFRGLDSHHTSPNRLNGVRPRWPEQSRDLEELTQAQRRLNGVRPRWPEQFSDQIQPERHHNVSMESGLDGRNNVAKRGALFMIDLWSQWSPA